MRVGAVHIGDAMDEVESLLAAGTLQLKRVRARTTVIRDETAIRSVSLFLKKASRDQLQPQFQLQKKTTTAHCSVPILTRPKQ